MTKELPFSRFRKTNRRVIKQLVQDGEVSLDFYMMCNDMLLLYFSCINVSCFKKKVNSVDRNKHVKKVFVRSSFYKENLSIDRKLAHSFYYRKKVDAPFQMEAAEMLIKLSAPYQQLRHLENEVETFFSLPGKCMFLQFLQKVTVFLEKSH